MLMQVDREFFIREIQYLRPNRYSRGALSAMFDYFEDLDEGEHVVDAIRICCEYTEYKDLKEFQDNYGTEYKTIENIRELYPQPTVIEVPILRDRDGKFLSSDGKGFIVQNF